MIQTSITILVICRTTENVLLLFLRMDFFDKLKSSLSSPLRNFSSSSGTDTTETIKTRILPVPNFTPKHIRLLIYRDCDRRGRKCLYDSHHVIRDCSGKFSYITSGTSGSEMKNLSEYIFGCVPLSANAGCKRFHKYDGKYVWSQVFCPKPCRSSSISSSTFSKEKLIPGNHSPLTPLSQSPITSRGTDQVDGPKIGVVNSLPNIEPAFTSSFGKCLSLPSKLHESHQKTVLGLGIMIETIPENLDTLGQYLQAMSGMLEECSTWFSIVASQAYCNPKTFVQTLYDFSTQFKNLLHSRLTSPLVMPLSLTPNWKALPALTSELTQLILQHDECHCKLNNRIKIVIIGSSKKHNEVASLLYFFKILLLQCSRNNETDVGIDATALCGPSACPTTNVSSKSCQFQPTPQLRSQSMSYESMSMSSSSAAISMSSTALSMASTSPPSPPASEPILIHQIAFTLTTPKLEEEKLQKRDYDSGIELELDCSSANLNSKSMRRSMSQKFDSGCGSSSDEFGSLTSNQNNTIRRYSRGTLLYRQQSHEFEEVSFHLGDLGIDSEQSINTLALSEPNLDKLKVYVGSPSIIEQVATNTKIERISSDPIPVKINFGMTGSNMSKSPVRHYCPYCDAVGIVSKFSPLYYIQWIKTSCCTSGLSEENFNLMKSFSTSKFIVINLDKSLIRTINFDSNDTSNLPMSCNSSNTSLVQNLLHNLHVLSTENRETEIEQFLQVQLDFIKKIALEFGESWISSRTEDSSLKKKYSYLSLGDNDLKLIYSLAKMKFPSLAQED